MTKETYGDIVNTQKLFDARIQELCECVTVTAFLQNRDILVRPLSKMSWASATYTARSRTGGGSWQEEATVDSNRFAETIKENYGITSFGELFLHVQAGGKLLPEEVMKKHTYISYPCEKDECITKTYQSYGLYGMIKKPNDFLAETQNLSYEEIGTLIEAEKAKHPSNKPFIENVYAYGLSLIDGWKLTHIFDKAADVLEKDLESSWRQNIRRIIEAECSQKGSAEKTKTLYGRDDVRTYFQDETGNIAASVSNDDLIVADKAGQRMLHVYWVDNTKAAYDAAKVSQFVSPSAPNYEPKDESRETSPYTSFVKLFGKVAVL